MAEDIHILIGQLQIEAANLKRLIREAVSDGEFLIAHFHNQALEQVSQQLQTAKNLDDKLYQRKENLRRGIRGSEEMINKQDYPEVMREYVEKMIAKNHEELAELNMRGKVPVVQSDLLGQRFQLLLEKKVRYVKIILMKSEGFALEIRRSRMGLKVSIPNVRSLRKSYLMDDERFQKLETLGFRTTNDETKLVLFISSETTDLLGRLNILICRIAFDIFYFAEFEGETFLEWG